MSFWDDTIGAADRAIKGALGGPAVYRAQDGTEYSLEDAIFSDEHVAILDPEAPISTSAPTIFIRVEDLPVDVGEDDGFFVVRNVQYRPIDVLPDGEGGIVVSLHKVRTLP